MKARLLRLASVLLIGMVNAADSFALDDKVDSTCNYFPASGWVCSSEIIDVVGVSSDFGCDKNPSNCIPIDNSGSSGSPSGGKPDGRGGRGGYEVDPPPRPRLPEDPTKLSCNQLKGYLDFYTEQLNDDRQRASRYIREAAATQRLIDGPRYSASEFDRLNDNVTMACTAYQDAKQQRLSRPKECLEKPGKPPVCKAFLPGPQEDALNRMCYSAIQEVALRAQILRDLEFSQQNAQEDAVGWTNMVRQDQANINLLKDQMKKKSCG